MLVVLSITLPIYLLVALGYVVTRFGVFSATAIQALGKYVVAVALPALLFKALAQRGIGEVFDIGYLSVYLVGSALAIAVGLIWFLRVQKHDLTTGAAAVMGMANSNNGFVGYPIVLLTFGEIAGQILALNFLVEVIFIIPFLIILMERGQATSDDPWAVLLQVTKQVVSNPIIIAMAAGVVVSVLGLELPAAITRSVDLLASSSGAVSLFVIGGTLYGLPLKGMNSLIGPIVAGKLIVHPLLVAAVLLGLSGLGVIEMSPVLRVAVILSAGMPTMSIYPLITQTYGKQGFSAVVVLATTVLSFVTISALLWLLT